MHVFQIIILMKISLIRPPELCSLDERLGIPLAHSYVTMLSKESGLNIEVFGFYSMRGEVIT